MHSLPLFLDPSSVRCVVVGGGEVATRKLRTLLDAGVNCRVVARVLHHELAQLVEEHSLDCERRPFRADDLEHVNLVIAATDDKEANLEIHRLAIEAGVWINAVDDLDHSSAIFPSIINRDPVTVAISTAGHSPTLARRLRARVETILSSGLGRLALYMGERRSGVGKELSDPRSRRDFWDSVLDGPIPDLVEAGRIREADEVLEDSMRGIRGSSRRGLVSLVGAGPGDPDLLTLKALECLQRADVVYYDNLISDQVLDRIRRDAKRVYVGKRRGVEGKIQQVINEMLVHDALAGLRVVRLKGGDPLIFGRGGEELEALKSADIEFEVVPGITAASGSAAIAGVPLTHRDVAHSVRFITAQVSAMGSDIDWEALVGERQTLVVYMGLSELAVVTQKLFEHGMDELTPVAVVSRASYHDQKVVTGTLSNIVGRVESNDVSGPTTIIVGRVVALSRSPSKDS